MALKTLLLDTNAYSAFKQDQPGAVEIVQHAPNIVFNSIVLGELFSGFASGTREAQNRQELEEFCSSRRVQRLLVDDRTAEFYARISSDLRRRGRPIPTKRHMDRRLGFPAWLSRLHLRPSLPGHRRSLNR